jgi:hypothetical protein
MSLYNNYQDRPGWAYVEANELYYRNVHHTEVDERHIEHDYLHKGLWVDLSTPTATLLSLKGCRFLNTKLQSRRD